MKLSLMLLNLTFPIFMGADFTFKSHVDIEEYESVLKMAADAGYEAVDLSSREFELFGAEAVKALLDKYALKCASIILFENYTCMQPEQQSRIIEHSKQIVDAAVVVDCPVLMLVAMGIQPGQEREENQKGLVENFKKVCAYAEDKGVQVCAEDFPSIEVPMCSRTDMDLLLDSVKGLKLVYDNGNMLVAGEDPAAYFEHFKEKIGYYHVKEVRIVEAEEAIRLVGRQRPAGDLMQDGRFMVPTLHGKGILELSELMKWMKEAGYRGYMSVEYAPGPGDSRNHLENIVAAKELLEGFIAEA